MSLFSHIAFGEVVRKGPVVVFKKECIAFNLDELSNKLPEGVSSYNQIVLIALNSIRDLTPEEEALCTGKPIIVPKWRVHDNGNITRPAYTFTNGLLIKHKTKRAQIGELCGELAIAVKNSKTREYRYLISDDSVASICVLE